MDTMSDILASLTTSVNFAIVDAMAEPKKHAAKDSRPRVVVDLPKKDGKELWKALRMRAIAEDKPVSELVFDAIRAHLAKEKK